MPSVRLTHKVGRAEGLKEDMIKYNVDGFKFMTHTWERVTPTWAHVWLLVKVLFTMNVLMWSVGSPLIFWAVAVVMTYAVYEINRI